LSTNENFCRGWRVRSLKTSDSGSNCGAFHWIGRKMRNQICSIASSICLCLVVSCSSAVLPAATVAPQPPTATLVPPTSTPTPVPTPTETPELVLPVLAGTPIPRPSVALGFGNTAQMTDLARWVQGSDPEFNHGLAFYSSDGRFLAVYSSDGIHLYNADSLTQTRLIESPPAWR